MVVLGWFGLFASVVLGGWSGFWCLPLWLGWFLVFGQVSVWSFCVLCELASPGASLRGLRVDLMLFVRGGYLGFGVLLFTWFPC